MSRASEKAEAARMSALRTRLKLPDPPTDAASLARSYGLPEQTVANIMKEMSYGR